MIYYLKINDIEQSFEFLLMPRLVCSHAYIPIITFQTNFFCAHNLMTSICFTFSIGKSSNGGIFSPISEFRI